MRLIDADALLERVGSEKIQAQAHGREFSTCFNSPGGTLSTEWWYVEDLIENAPTIEPERKTGHWILGGYDDMYYVCDQCGYRRSDYYAKPKAKYCENCGADMRGEEK